MNLTMTPERIAESVEIGWTTAMRYLLEGNLEMAEFSFGAIADRLDGMWMMVNYGADRVNENDEMEELFEAIALLRGIAEKLSSSMYHIQNDEAA